MTERSLTFDCFGGTVSVRAAGSAARVPAIERLLGRCRERLLEIHAVLTCFAPDSELSRLNADPRSRVPAAALVRRLAAAVPWAGRLSDGLVDATCRPSATGGGWQRVGIDRAGRGVIRPAGVRIDSGGLAKGMAADLIGAALGGADAWVVDCAGDLRLGGRAHENRIVEVRDPWGGDPVHRAHVRQGAVATSGITKRSWAGGHHLVDPRTGAPADTGLVQVTAFAPTGLEAEVRAKAALLSGPDGAAARLPHGGVVIAASGAVEVLEAAR